MNEWLQQYWTFYHAGVFIFLIAGLALIFRFLILRKKKKQPGETKLSFKHWNERFNKDYEQLELEMRKFPHSRSLENVDYLSKVRGAMIGCKKAEAFEVIKIYNK